MKKKYADMDPIEEIRAIREELSREFPTAKALGEYLRKNYPTNPSVKSPRKGRRASVKTKGRSAPPPLRRNSATHA